MSSWKTWPWYRNAKQEEEVKQLRKEYNDKVEKLKDERAERKKEHAEKKKKERNRKRELRIG